MCGIIGYLGKRRAAGVVLESLKRLEYRGYDSAGICVVSVNGTFKLVREVGKLARLEERLKANPIDGKVAIGHSRWATHGPPSEENAHPHADCKKEVVLVHNGIIENYLELRKVLANQGHRFRSQTDTEVIANILENELKRFPGVLSNEKTILGITRKVIAKLKGAYALVVLSQKWPGTLVGVRKDCPLVAGISPEEAFLASDLSALLPFTKKALFMEDGEIALLRSSGTRLYSAKGLPIARRVEEIPWSATMAERDGHKHFMHKEMFEEPRSFEDTLRSRTYENNIDALLEEAGLTRAICRQAKRVKFVACGTAHHSGMLGTYLFENLAGLPATAEIASEFRYRANTIERDTLLVAISQSGETADTLAAVRLARKLAPPSSGLRTIGIVNQIGSTLTREVSGCVYTRCGPEIGVASTKAFQAQLAVLYLLSFAFGRVRREISERQFNQLTSELLELPAKLRSMLTE